MMVRPPVFWGELLAVEVDVVFWGHGLAADGAICVPGHGGEGGGESCQGELDELVKLSFSYLWKLS